MQKSKIYPYRVGKDLDRFQCQILTLVINFFSEQAFLPILFVFLLGTLSAQVSVVDFSLTSNLTVYEHNHYAFRADGNNSITVVLGW